MKRFFPIVIFFGICVVFFYQFFFLGKFPIPSDTIVGLYHPYRDLYAATNPNGIAYKNFLITDPVRQQYPWRELAIAQLKQGELPLWNPYSFSGTPLLANFQTAAFYPLNILLFILPFTYGWSILVFLQPFLAGVFMYYYLRYFNLRAEAAILGGVTFAFCGFNVAWMEWNTIGHTALWLPLFLLAKEHLLRKRSWRWMAILIFAESSLLLAGHLQTFLYALLFSNIYLAIRMFQFYTSEDERRIIRLKSRLITFSMTGGVVALLTAIQWIPTLQFIFASARNLDQGNWQKEGWFIPWQHLIQFLAPDFFGNPATLNYWGTWNYGELVGYIGVVPLVFALYAFLFRRDKKVFFSATALILILLFALPTILAKIPYILQIPFLSSTQPTRLLFLIDFLLAFLAALGLDYYIRHNKRIYIPILMLGVIIGGLWVFVLSGVSLGMQITVENLGIAKRNLYLPTALLVSTGFLIIPQFIHFRKKIISSIIIIFILLTVFDLFRFFDKFTPFTNKEYLFPQTKTISFLQNQPKPFRIMSLDSRILPPNFSAMYRIETIEGYDPLYLRRYGELVAASERGKPDISGPFGFNRIITPHNINSSLINVLNVKYILSLEEIHREGFKKVFEEGQTKVYENTHVFPRAFFVLNSYDAENQQEAIEKVFTIDTKTEAVLQPYGNVALNRSYKQGKIISSTFSENTFTIKTQTDELGLLIVTNSWYPTLRLKIDNIEKKDTLLIANYNFIGIPVQSGNHTITLEYR